MGALRSIGSRLRPRQASNQSGLEIHSLSPPNHEEQWRQTDQPDYIDCHVRAMRLARTLQSGQSDEPSDGGISSVRPYELWPYERWHKRFAQQLESYDSGTIYASLPGPGPSHD